MSSKTIKIENVTFSMGNRKLGGIPSVSLLPQLSCGKHCGCALLCMRDCYAMKMQGYTSVAPSWKQNTEVCAERPRGFGSAVLRFLEKANPDRFRWHVGGDIPDADYLELILWTAKRFPNTRFRLFTKAYNLLPIEHPRLKNLRIGISRWPGMGNPRLASLRGYSHSWLIPNPKSMAVLQGRLVDPGYKIPKSARSCPGNCESCDLCWSIKANQHVKFEQH